MTDSLSEKHAKEIDAARYWHATAPATLVRICILCRGVKTFLKSRWNVGAYACETCGYRIDEPWRS